ncbi:MAG: AI-2E family transporter [Rhodobacteraceae bacterium]|nr:AI-2E family transporter [Paracoccaceae bacterium]
MRFAYSEVVVSAAATLWLLIQGKEVLQPLLVALVCWFLINALARQYARLLGASPEAPGMLSTLLSIITAVAIAAILGLGITRNLALLQGNIPLYEANLDVKLGELNSLLGTTLSLDFEAMVAGVDLGEMALTLAGSAVGFITALVVVIVYTAFLFAEASVFQRKLAALQLSSEGAAQISETLRRIQRMIEVYFGVKCLIGLAQAVPTFVLLWWLGVDAPEFWSVLIFVFSFVPTIGSLIGIIFPSLLAFLQFPTIEPFFITLGCLAVVQLLGSNWLEPKLTGDSLDLSALVVLLGVFIGAALWGIVGALIAVPLLSIAMLVFANIETMRPVAILMSGGQGDIDLATEEARKQ